MAQEQMKYRFRMYEKLQKEIPQIYAELKDAAKELKLKDDEKNSIGLTGAVSGCPGTLRDDVLQGMHEKATKVISNAALVDEIREIVKSYYGDDYDACPVNTCEAALWVSFDCLATPPFTGRGDNYRARYIAPFERHLHHQGGYGRPFPPKYKDVLADRGSTAGELGFAGKRQNNLDTVFVPLPGANYDVHGIRSAQVFLMKNVDADLSAKVLEQYADRHAQCLTALSSLGYDTTGYGYGAKKKNGAPKLQGALSKIAHKYNIPYIVDNAWGLPFVGTDIRKTGADVMLYSMDKASGAPTSGLIIGKEDVMVPIRRALGVHGARWGTTSSYGKAAYVTQDPGKEALSGQIAALKALRENPEIVTNPLEDLYRLVVEEFDKINPALRPFFQIEKSYNSAAIEVNYEASWEGTGMGIPIFSIEDMYSGSHILQNGLAQIGIIPTIAYDANIFISAGLGTSDNAGRLIVERMRKAVRALVLLIEIVSKHAGLIG